MSLQLNNLLILGYKYKVVLLFSGFFISTFYFHLNGKIDSLSNYCVSALFSFKLGRLGFDGFVRYICRLRLALLVA